MATSNEQNPMTTSGLAKRLKPQLKLATNQPNFEEKKIHIRKNSLNGYVIENHPIITDASKSASATHQGTNVFFTGSHNEERNGDDSFSGAYFYILQKSNGKEMQDRYKASPKTPDDNMAFFAVFDGHSTQFVPEIVAQKLDNYFRENLKSEHHIISALQKAFCRMEEEIVTHLKEKMMRGGTTALCAVFHEKKLYIANLGDSQAVIFQKSSFTSLSNLHDFHNETERLAVEKKGGIILRDRLEGELAISRSIGDVRFKTYMSSEPEITTYEIKESDEYLLIGTDGFWNGLSPQLTLDKIKEFKEKGFSENLNLKLLGNYLMEEACRNIKTKKDNMSLIVISIRDYLSLEEAKSSTNDSLN